jgi:hypothetical protein
MKQQYELGQEVFVFRTVKGEVSAGKGVIHLAEINTSGYVQYSVKVTKADGSKDTWQVNHASMATSEEDLKKKIDTYVRFNDEQKAKYVELFGAPEFNPVELGLK